MSTTDRRVEPPTGLGQRAARDPDVLIMLALTGSSLLALVANADPRLPAGLCALAALVPIARLALARRRLDRPRLGAALVLCLQAAGLWTAHGPDVTWLGTLSVVVAVATLTLSAPSIPRGPALLQVCLDVVLVASILLTFAWAAGLGARTFQASSVLGALGVGHAALLTLRGRRTERRGPLGLAAITLLVLGGIGEPLLPTPVGAGLGIVGAALLALVATRTRPPEPSGQPDLRPLPQLLVGSLPYATVASVFVAVLAVGGLDRIDRTLVGALLALSVLVLARQALAHVEHLRLAHELRRSSSELQASRERLTHQAEHDHLTGLRNRVNLEETVAEAIEAAREAGELAAVLFIDLDRMKQINDSYGHPTGDLVLKEMSRRLVSLLRSDDIVARWGGDEFVLVLRRVRQPRDAGRVADKLLSLIAQPVRHGSEKLFLTASIGIALCPRDARDASTALQCADLAMYHAKEQGKNAWRYFDERSHQTTIHKVQLESHLRFALDHGELEVHFQPLVRLDDGEVLGFEALVRWPSPIGETVPTSELIAVAEERGLIVQLGEWVLERALWQARKWRAIISPGIFVSVNVSALQFVRADFVDRVVALLDAQGVPGDALMLELTETTLMTNVDESVEKLQVLKARGVRLALDDFGTGYSSLSYLRQFPVSVLKVDRSFVGALSSDGDVFVRAITMLAHDLGLTVIAEGVEHAWQSEQLVALGSDLGQGFLLGRPMSAPEVERTYEEIPTLLAGEDDSTQASRMGDA